MGYFDINKYKKELQDIRRDYPNKRFGETQIKVLLVMRRYSIELFTASELSQITGIPLTGYFGGVYKILHNLADGGYICRYTDGRRLFFSYDVYETYIGDGLSRL